jgi:hypothetical protein
MLFFLSIRSTDHRLVVPGFQRAGELSAHNPMVVRLAGHMHIDQEVLIVNGDFDLIAGLQRGESFVFPHVHGHEPRFHLTGIDACLFASDLFDGAQQHAVSGKKLMGVCGRGCKRHGGG